MLPQKKHKYDIWPSVVLSDAITEMTIAPIGRAFLLFEGKEYTVRIIPVNSDVPAMREPNNQTVLTVAAHGGVVRFSHCFVGEQEYTVILEDGDTIKQEMAMYAVRKDLYELRPLKGDLHTHSFRSDGSSDPAELAGHHREQGYDFFALTDHNRYYPGDEIDEVYRGVRMGLCHVFGEEVHTPDSDVHIVHVGGKSSVCKQYCDDVEGYRREVDAYEARVPATVPTQYRRRYAMAMWATDRIHEVGGLAIFAHPYWRPGYSKTYNVCDELSEIFLKSGMFDAYELVGAMSQPGVNLSVALWGDLRAEGLSIPVVGSSDVHSVYDSLNFPGHFTVCFAKENENDAIIEAVRNGMSVAVEGTGDEYERHYRCYGSHRLVSYAQFLLQYYFPRLQRICQGEGVAMRAYAMGEADAPLIEVQAENTAFFVDRFLGRKPAVLPSEEMLAFEDRARALHLQSPHTRGSSILYPTVNRQI